MRSRIWAFLIGPSIVLAAFALTELLPPVRSCEGWCGPGFDPGSVPVFGRHNLTPLQTAVLLLGIWAGSYVVLRAVLPAHLRWTSVGAALFVVALAVAVALPSETVGEAPSIPCSTPGANGPVMGRCVTGIAPQDERLTDRAMVLATGAIGLGVALSIDRRGRGEVTRRPAEVAHRQ
jgi:hypothetical protein